MSGFDDLSSAYQSVLCKDVRWFGESPDYFAYYKARYVYDHLGPGFKGSILDYGCGIGSVTKWLNRLFDHTGADVLGYDVSVRSIEQACKNNKGIDFTHDKSYVESRIFNAVILANVLHHVAKGDRVLFLKDTIGRLNKDGVIIIFEHNPYNPLTQAVVRSSVIDKGAVLVSSKDMNNLLRLAGIRVTGMKYILFFPHFLRFLRPLESKLSNLPIGAQYVFTGQAI